MPTQCVPAMSHHQYQLAFGGELYASFPPDIHEIVNKYGGMWGFVSVKNLSDFEKDYVSSYLAGLLCTETLSPESKSITATMLSYLGDSSWTQCNRDRVWDFMNMVFLRLRSWAPGRSRIFLAMCFFGDDDVEHGRKMRAVLRDVEDASERVALAQFIFSQVSTNMADSILLS